MRISFLSGLTRLNCTKVTTLDNIINDNDDDDDDGDN